MTRLVYACRFDVASIDGSSSVLATYTDWIVRHYREWRQLSGFKFDPESSVANEEVPDGHLLSSSIYQDGEERVIRIRWSFPDDNDDGLRWANEVRVGQFCDRCGVEHLISIESVEYSVSPARLLFGSPRAVRDICTRTSATIGQMQVMATPYALEGDGLNVLLDLLTSNLRKLPVVLISPYARGEPNQIDAEKLARNLAGVAVVVRAEDPELTWDFADEVGRQMSCFNGAARIYWPGFSKEADPRSHRLFLGAWIEQVGPGVAARTIERSIFAVAAFRYVPDERIAEVIRSVEAAERQKLLLRRKAAGDEFLDHYERDLARLEECEKLRETLEAENANLRANQRVFFTAGTGGPEEFTQAEEAEGPTLSSVSEAVLAAAERCRHIEILDSAKSAAEASPFQRPHDIFEALTALDEIVDEWRVNLKKTGNGGAILQHLRDRGWGKRSSMRISDTTRGKFRAHYEFEYQGRKQLFEPHITIGAGDPNRCASIHFIFDQDRPKIIVGYVGKHLPNTKS